MNDTQTKMRNEARGGAGRSCSLPPNQTGSERNPKPPAQLLTRSWAACGWQEAHVMLVELSCTAPGPHATPPGPQARSILGALSNPTCLVAKSELRERLTLRQPLGPSRVPLRATRGSIRSWNHCQPGFSSWLFLGQIIPLGHSFLLCSRGIIRALSL